MSRRAVLAAGSLLGVGLACSSCGGRSPPSSRARAPVASGPELAGDLRMVALAASLENLAVGLYDQAQHILASGQLGVSQPAVTMLARTAEQQHSDHARAWNAMLGAARKAKVTGPDPILKPQIDQAFSQVREVSSLMELMLVVERTAAATYQEALGTMQGTHAIGTAATIYPVEMAHAAMLRLLLGQYPVPDAFAPADLARPPSDYQG